MTDLIREVKTRLKEVGDDRNKSLDLAVRVPPTIHDSVRTGLDVQEWISEGLVDIVIVGGGFIPFDTPVKEFVKVAEDSKVDDTTVDVEREPTEAFLNGAREFVADRIPVLSPG